MDLAKLTDFKKWNFRVKLFAVVATASTGATITALNIAPIDGLFVGALVGVIASNADIIFNGMRKKKVDEPLPPIDELKTFDDLLPFGVGDFNGKKFERGRNNGLRPTAEYRAFLAEQMRIKQDEGLI